MKHTTMALVLAALGAAPLAHADLIAGKPPVGPLHVSSWINQNNYQTFLVRFDLERHTRLTGFDIYTASEFDTLGQEVVVTIRRDYFGQPSRTDLLEFTDTVESVGPFSSEVRISHVEFDETLTLWAREPRSYWISVSGAQDSLSWASFRNGVRTPVDQRILVGDTVGKSYPIHELAYRLHGFVPQVPEPHPGWMAGLGLAFVAALGRRQRRAREPANLNGIGSLMKPPEHSCQYQDQRLVHRARLPRAVPPVA